MKPALARCFGILLLTFLFGGAPAFAAAGSWVFEWPRRVVAVSEHPLEGPVVMVPPHVNVGRLTRIHWSFDASEPLRVWLCQASDCVALQARRGVTEHFAGRALDAPLRLRFWRAGSAVESPGRAAVVSQGRLIVDYRH